MQSIVEYTSIKIYCTCRIKIVYKRDCIIRSYLGYVSTSGKLLTLKHAYSKLLHNPSDSWVQYQCWPSLFLGTIGQIQMTNFTSIVIVEFRGLIKLENGQLDASRQDVYWLAEQRAAGMKSTCAPQQQSARIIHTAASWPAHWGAGVGAVQAAYEVHDAAYRSLPSAAQLAN